VGSYLTVEEVAELARCGHKAVRRAIRDGALRAFRPTKRLLIREEDATAWIESCAAAVAREPGIRSPTTRRSSTSTARAGTVAALRRIEREALGA
jgi:excisionase family DNA binding protein